VRGYDSAPMAKSEPAHGGTREPASWETVQTHAYASAGESLGRAERYGVSIGNISFGADEVGGGIEGKTVQRVIEQRRDGTIQRNERDNPDDFIAWIQLQPDYTKYAGREAGQCAPAARDIGDFLTMAGFAIQYRGILIFYHKYSQRQKKAVADNKNHFVIVAKIAGVDIVIDPTQNQFEGGSPQVAREGEWIARFANLSSQHLHGEGFEYFNLPKKYVDRATFAEANEYAKQGGMLFADAPGTHIGPDPSILGDLSRDPDGNNKTGCAIS